MISAHTKTSSYLPTIYFWNTVEQQKFQPLFRRNVLLGSHWLLLVSILSIWKFGGHRNECKRNVPTFVANLKSGDNAAADVIAICRSVLNPIQIFELSSAGPDEALNLIRKMDKIQCRILVAGGDGTVGWILTEIFKRQINPLPEVCILPIGTGNDLSRVLGWGAVPPAVLHPNEMCDKVWAAPPIKCLWLSNEFRSPFLQIQKSQAVLLDRWLIDIESKSSRRLPMKWLPHRKLYMYNYFSVGVDAQVTFNFHKARESPFYMLSSRLFNKVNHIIQDRMPFEAQFIFYIPILYAFSDPVPLLWYASGRIARLCWTREKNRIVFGRRENRIAWIASSCLPEYWFMGCGSSTMGYVHRPNVTLLRSFAISQITFSAFLFHQKWVPKIVEAVLKVSPTAC